MEPARRAEIGVVLLAMFAWSVYCLFFLLVIRTPAIDGAAEAADEARLTITGSWLAGLGIGALTIFALQRGAFDARPSRLRGAYAVGGLLVAAVLVVGLYWLGRSATLLFIWGPLVAGVLLLIGWASTPPLRQRLRQALLGWLGGVAAVAVLFFALPPGTLGFHFWTLLALVSLAAAVWWAWPLVSARASGVESR